MPAVDGSTVHTKDWLAVAPLPSVAVTVTVLVPAAVGAPVIAPVLALSEKPVGRPLAEAPATCSCGPGLVSVTGWPSWLEATDSVPVSGRLALESPTEMP